MVALLDTHEKIAQAIEDSDRYLTGERHRRNAACAACTFRGRGTYELAPCPRHAVFDVHQNWCGPCTVMEAVFRKAYLELDKAEERLKIYTVEESLLTEEQKAKMPAIHGCKPMFILYKNKVIIGKVLGVNAPELETQIMDNVPALEAED